MTPIPGPCRCWPHICADRASWSVPAHCAAGSARPGSAGSVRATSTASGRRRLAPKKGIIRRLKRKLQAGDVLLFTDWTLLRLFPPLRAMWAAIGTQAKVAITGQNARRVLFGTINVRTARRTVYIGRSAGAHEVQAFLLALRKAYRRAGTIWLLARPSQRTYGAGDARAGHGTAD